MKLLIYISFAFFSIMAFSKSSSAHCLSAMSNFSASAETNGHVHLFLRLMTELLKSGAVEKSQLRNWVENNFKSNFLEQTDDLNLLPVKEVLDELLNLELDLDLLRRLTLSLIEDQTSETIWSEQQSQKATYAFAPELDPLRLRVPEGMSLKGFIINGDKIWYRIMSENTEGAKIASLYSPELHRSFEMDHNIQNNYLLPWKNSGDMFLAVGDNILKLFKVDTVQGEIIELDVPAELSEISHRFISFQHIIEQYIIFFDARDDDRKNIIINFQTGAKYVVDRTKLREIQEVPTDIALYHPYEYQRKLFLYKRKDTLEDTNGLPDKLEVINASDYKNVRYSPQNGEDDFEPGHDSSYWVD